MKDIPMYQSFTKICNINKGMSGDQKFYIETAEGKPLLLRISDFGEYDRKKLEYEIVKSMFDLEIPMPTPIDFGICNGGKSVYTLLSWIDGEEVEVIVPRLSQQEQYELGLESGKILRKIHMHPAPAGIENWDKRYFGVIDERLDAFRNEGVFFEGSDVYFILYRQKQTFA